MRLPKHVVIFCISIACSSVQAGWTDLAPVKKINIGPNGMHATAIQLENISFIGCTSTKTAILLPDNANYKEIVSALLSAKMADSQVQVLVAGCDTGYSVIQEVVF